MKYLMIHHVVPSVLITLKHFSPDYYTFIFDDGLYSLYYYRESLLKLPNRKILAITPNLLSLDNTSQIWKETCSGAMSKFFIQGNTSGFLTLSQVKELCSDGEYPCECCYHGYDHDVVLHGLSIDKRELPSWRYYKYPEILEEKRKFYNIDSCLSAQGFFIKNNKFISFTKKEYQDRLDNQISNMVEFFDRNLPDRTNLFVPPFNTVSRELIDTLSKFNITDIIGAERIDIAEYINNYYTIFDKNISSKSWLDILNENKNIKEKTNLEDIKETKISKSEEIKSLNALLSDNN